MSVYKVNEGRPNVADEIVNHKVDLVINTPLGRESFFDDRMVRRAAMMHEVPCITTLTGAAAAVRPFARLRGAGPRASAHCRTTTQEFNSEHVALGRNCTPRARTATRTQRVSKGNPSVSLEHHLRSAACKAALHAKHRGDPSSRHSRRNCHRSSPF